MFVQCLYQCGRAYIIQWQRTHRMSTRPRLHLRSIPIANSVLFNPVQGRWLITSAQSNQLIPSLHAALKHLSLADMIHCGNAMEVEIDETDDFYFSRR